MIKIQNSEFDVALLGSSGFLAKPLLNILNRNKKSVLVIGIEKPEVLFDNIEFVYFNLLEPKSIFNLNEKIKIRNFIFSAVLKGRYKKKTEIWQKQGIISAPDFNLLFDFLGLDVDKLITIGSSEEYGPRNDNSLIYENDLMNPLSSYGYWKTILYKNAVKWGAINNSEIIHLRPFVIYGFGQDENMFLGSLIKTLLLNKEFKMTKGEQWRSFINIEIVCEFIIELIRLKKFKYNSVNVSSDIYIKMVDLAKIIFKIIKKGSLDIGGLDYREFEVWHQKPSLKRFGDIFKNKKDFDFEDDLKKLIKIERKKYEK